MSSTASILIIDEHTMVHLKDGEDWASILSASILRGCSGVIGMHDSAVYMPAMSNKKIRRATTKDFEAFRVYRSSHYNGMYDA